MISLAWEYASEPSPQSFQPSESCVREARKPVASAVTSMRRSPIPSPQAVAAPGDVDSPTADVPSSSGRPRSRER